MAETKIRVEPNSVRSYGTKAQSRFDGVRSDLVALVNEVATVHYFGPNAAGFKKQSAELAADFASRLLKDIQNIANAVRGSTSSIAGSLGGSPITIQVDGAQVPVPAINPGDGAVDVDLTELEQLMPAVKSRFAKINEGLQSHLSDLRATDWTGTAKTSTVDGVARFTTAAIQKSGEAEKSITTYIRSQIDATKAADK